MGNKVLDVRGFSDVDILVHEIELGELFRVYVLVGFGADYIFDVDVDEVVE